MVTAMPKPLPSPEGTGEGAVMPGIEKIPAISDRVWRWVLWHRDEKCSKNPSLPYDSCSGCQGLQEKYGIDAPYSDPEFSMPPHGPQVRSMTEKFMDVTILTLQEWGMLSSEYSVSVVEPKRKERKRRIAHATR